MSTTNLNRFSNAGNHQISLAAGNLVLLRPGVVGVPPRKDPNHSFRQLGQPNLGWPERSSYQVGFLGRFFFLGGKHAYLYTWNPNDPCFVWKGPCFGGFNLQNRGQTGSRCILYIYILYICILYSIICLCNAYIAHFDNLRMKHKFSRYR